MWGLVGFCKDLEFTECNGIQGRIKVGNDGILDQEEGEMCRHIQDAQHHG